MTDSYLESLIKQRDALAQKYRGVRPSWVSTDLALLNHQIEQLKKEK